MKTTLHFMLFLMIGMTADAQAPEWIWAKQSTGDSNEAATSVTSDAAGNVYAAGSFILGPVNLGLGNIANNGLADYFLVKYNAEGVPQWAKNGGGAGNDYIDNLATDQNNNVYALCYFDSQSVVFGDFLMTNTDTTPDIFTGQYTADLALVKYDTNGTVLWAQKIGGIQREFPDAVAIDVTGNVFVSGRYESPVLTTGNVSLSNSSAQAFLVKYDADGNALWIRDFGGSGYNDVISAPVFDSENNFVIAGLSDSDSVTIGNMTFTNPNPGSKEGYVAKYNTNGLFIWGEHISGAADDSAMAVAISNSDDIYVTLKSASNPFTINGTNYANPTERFNGVVKMDQNGAVLWVKNIAALDDHLARIISDGTSIYVSGNFYSQVNFGSDVYPANENGDLFTAKLDAAGNFLWSKITGSNSEEYIYDMKMDDAGNLLFAGYFNSPTLALGSTTLTNSSNPNIYNDLFVAKLASTTLGNAVFKADGLSIYPNPTQDKITIVSNDAVIKINVSDVGGRTVKIINQQSDIDLSGLNKGIYFLNIQTGRGNTVRKIIKE